MSQRWITFHDADGESRYRCRNCGAWFWEGEGEHRSGCEFAEADDEKATAAENQKQNQETK